jgi:hypothetical protein
MTFAARVGPHCFARTAAATDTAGRDPPAKPINQPFVVVEGGVVEDGTKRSPP